MRHRLPVVFVVAAGLLLSLPLAAHHGVSTFDSQKTVRVSAAVVSWTWGNPHCFLKLALKDDQGKVTYWLGESSSPQDLTNLGWNSQSFKPGDEVTVIMTPAKNGSHLGLIQQVLLPNGQTLRARRDNGVVRIMP
jgi:hypothetical protein